MLSAQQIIAQANQIAKTPGFTSQAAVALNLALQQLAQDYDFPINRKLTAINVTGNGTAQAISLPADYLRIKECWYVLEGQPYYLTQTDLKDYDQSYMGNGIAGYPREYATDKNQSPVALYLYPPANFNLALNIRYMAQPADIANADSSGTIPWFENQTYLVTKVAADMMGIADDAREPTWQAKADDILRRYMPQMDDSEGRPHIVTLDPRRFKRGSARGIKTQGGF